MKSNPQALFFDTGVLVALFSRDPPERPTADAVLAYIRKYPHASRHVVFPSLVELFYKTLHELSPKDVRTNLDALAITVFPPGPSEEKLIFGSYTSSGYKGEFDFADYFVCRAALMFPHSEVLTIDRRDLPLALSRATQHVFENHGVSHGLTLVPFP